MKNKKHRDSLAKLDMDVSLYNQIIFANVLIDSNAGFTKYMRACDQMYNYHRSWIKNIEINRDINQYKSLPDLVVLHNKYRNQMRAHIRKLLNLRTRPLNEEPEHNVVTMREIIESNCAEANVIVRQFVNVDMALKYEAARNACNNSNNNMSQGNKSKHYESELYETLVYTDLNPTATCYVPPDMHISTDISKEPSNDEPNDESNDECKDDPIITELPSTDNWRRRDIHNENTVKSPNSLRSKHRANNNANHNPKYRRRRRNNRRGGRNTKGAVKNKRKDRDRRYNRQKRKSNDNTRCETERIKYATVNKIPYDPIYRTSLRTGNMFAFLGEGELR
jgi:hypothetical protein